MGDGEQRSFKESKETNKSKIPDFMKIDTIERLRKQDIPGQAKYASEHGVPNARDILRLADLSLPKVPVFMKGESAHDILKSVVNYSQQTLYRSGLSQNYPLADTALRQIDEALAQDKTLETSVQEIQHYDKYRHRLDSDEPSSIRERVLTLKRVLACLREKEREKLRQEGLADKVDIISDPQLQTDPFGYALSYGKDRIPDNDQQTIKNDLQKKYERVSSVLPGDRMVMYSLSRKAYVTAGLVEQCDWNTLKPTSISYLARRGGCIHYGRPWDHPQIARDNIEVQFYRRREVLDELVILGTNVKDPREAQVIIWCDLHTYDPSRVLYERISREYLEDGDTMIMEAPEKKDETVEMSDGRKIVKGTWDNAELREKFTEAMRQWWRIEDEMLENPEKASALKEELQGYKDEFYKFALERTKCLGTAIKDRTTRFPDRRLSVLVGRNHIMLDEHRKALDLDQYRHVVFISRYWPLVTPEATSEYTREALGSESKTEDTTG